MAAGGSRRSRKPRQPRDVARARCRSRRLDRGAAVGLRPVEPASARRPARFAVDTALQRSVAQRVRAGGDSARPASADNAKSRRRGPLAARSRMDARDGQAGAHRVLRFAVHSRRGAAPRSVPSRPHPRDPARRQPRLVRGGVRRGIAGTRPGFSSDDDLRRPFEAAQERAAPAARVRARARRPPAPAGAGRAPSRLAQYRQRGAGAGRRPASAGTARRGLAVAGAHRPRARGAVRRAAVAARGLRAAGTRGNGRRDAGAGESRRRDAERYAATRRSTAMRNRKTTSRARCSSLPATRRCARGLRPRAGRAPPCSRGIRAPRQRRPRSRPRCKPCPIRRHDGQARRRRARLARHLARRRERARRDPARLSGGRSLRAGRFPARRAALAPAAASARARRSCSACPAPAGISARCCRSFRARSSRSTFRRTTSSSRARTPSPRACARSAAQLHVCYCHTPMRYAWDLREQYLRSAGSRRACAARSSHRACSTGCATGTGAASDRVTHFVANSQFVRDRIARCYGRAATVIHPPVDTEFFTPATSPPRPLRAPITSPHRAGFRTSGWTSSPPRSAQLPDRRLVDRRRRPAKRLACAPPPAPTSNSSARCRASGMRDLLRGARAFVFAAEEDFGILPVEAQACGTPVIAYGRGGAWRRCATARRQRRRALLRRADADGDRRAVRRFERRCRRSIRARLPRARAAILGAAIRRRVRRRSSSRHGATFGRGGR